MQQTEDRGAVPVRSLFFCDRVLADPTLAISSPNMQRCSLSQLRGTETLVLHDVPPEEHRIRLTRAQFYEDPKRVLDRSEAAFNLYEKGWNPPHETRLNELPLVTQKAARELEGLNGLVWPSVANILKTYGAERRVCMRIDSNLAMYLPADSDRAEPALFVVTLNQAATQEYQANRAESEGGFSSHAEGGSPLGFLITLHPVTLMPVKAECKYISEDIFGFGTLMTHLCAGANRKLEETRD